MDSLHQLFRAIEPAQYLYGIVAICGGVARYLSGYADGKPFSLGTFVASAFVSGFSGWMFAVMGMSMSLPQSIVFIMAGTGGFFGDQTMKLVLEYVKSRAK